MPGDRDALVLRGGVQGSSMVFLHGMCVYPGYYVDSFVKTAAARGDLVALRGDVSCGSEWVASWSLDIVALDRRIDAAFVAAGRAVPSEVVLIGYSQGADRAEALVARFPAKYRAVVLIASSSPPSPVRLRTVRAAALIAGTRDSSANMTAGLAALRAAHVKATFLPMPGAWHGHMGTDPEATLTEALDFLQ